METIPFSTPKHDALVSFYLPGLFRQQVRARPDAVAATSGDRHLTYRELGRTSGRLAARLRELGVGADDCVGLFAEPSVELVSGVWGILLSGGAYLPLSPEYPDDRLRYMLTDSGADVVVAQKHLVARLSALVPRCTRILAVEDLAGPPAAPELPVQPDSLAYVIYTSGSTGRPKGVQIEHRSIASQLRWLHAFGHLGAETVVLQKTPMSFDAAQWELLAPAFGGRVVLGAPGAHRDPEGLIAAVVQHEVTTLQCVPTLLQALLDTERLGLCTSLRWVFSGGEALSWQLARQVTDELPRASLINLYGPTECTINATAHLVDPEELGRSGTVPIGVPVDNTQCYILDENASPADIGEIGSCTSEVCSSRAGTSTVRSRRRSASSRRRSCPPSACTGPGTWRAGTRRAASTSAGGRTTRSSCAGIASSWTRSRCRSRSTRGCGERRRSSPTTRGPGSRTWWPAWSWTRGRPR